MENSDFVDDHVPSAAKITPALRDSHVETFAQQNRHLQHVWIIAGPAGCGKSTVAQYVSSACKLPYLEGDEFHPAENIAKMASGVPLTDEDRWQWLETLRDKAVGKAAGSAKGCVVTCSCLKKKYRDVIRRAQADHQHVRVGFVYLAASEETLLQRVRARKGHYMKEDMVHSQFVTLEEPDMTEGDVVTIDCNVIDPETVQRRALEEVRCRMGTLCA